jgi:hypothetical protein
MAVHVAILKRPYLQWILSGRKTVESRLTRTAQPPYGAVQAGERLFLKVSAGPFLATAVAAEVEQLAQLTPEAVRKLYRKYNAAVCGDAAYWQSKAASRFATFIRLRDVEPIDVGPRYRKVNMKAWHVLPEQASPLMEVALTAGAIRNRYVRWPWPTTRAEADANGEAVTLLLADGQEVRTERVGGRLRWRGWAAYFAAEGLAGGDRVRFVAVGEGRYRVSFHRSRD